MFSSEFWEIPKNTFSTEHLGTTAPEISRQEVFYKQFLTHFKARFGFLPPENVQKPDVF